MLAIEKKPGKQANIITINNDLESLQKAVGGYIETVTIATDCCIICNEEGRLMGLPHNCTFLGVDFVGTILVVGVKGDEFCSLPLGAVKMLMKGLADAAN